MTQEEISLAKEVGSRLGLAAVEIYKLTHGGTMDGAPDWVSGGIAKWLHALCDARGDAWSNRFKDLAECAAEDVWNDAE